MKHSKKYTYPLFESCALVNGAIQNAALHSKRFFSSFKKTFGADPQYGLFEGVTIPKVYQKGVVKLRISYGLTGKSVRFIPYHKKNSSTLKLVQGNGVEYPFKFEDRSDIDLLYHKKEYCDDVLIIKNGLVTDTSYANIIFLRNGEWFTPDRPLLKGTMRSKLILKHKICAIKITPESLEKFEAFQLINAMMPFDEKGGLCMDAIVF